MQKIKDLLHKFGGCCARFALLLVALLVIPLIPIRVLFRRRPFRHFVFTVAYQWFKISTMLMRACGASCVVRTNINLQ